jgi:uroporphyrinogen decarboxylase
MRSMIAVREGMPGMDSRERTFLVLEHETGDRIPIDFWASRSMIRGLEQGTGLSYQAFLDHHDVDLRYIPGPEYIGPPLEDDLDIWGVRRSAVHVQVQNGTESYQEVSESPLSALVDLDQIEHYSHWPSPDAFDYSVIPGQCDRIRDQGRVVVFMGDRLNRVAQLKPTMYLRGIENTFVDLKLRPEIAHAILRKIREFYLVYLGRILEAAHGKIDIVLTGDDFGSQKGPLISPQSWRTFVEPGFSAYVALVKQHGARAMHHTCGSVAAIIPDMIACGLDILQSIQPEARDMSLAALKAEFGQDLCFHGGMSIQKTMPFGTPKEIRLEVKKIADTIRSDGGYIYCTAHNIQADTSLENVQALLAAYHEYGHY